MAEALYRKYRPQIFEDVVGQEHIERTLKNAIAQNKVSHAYLFTGPRGTGKTTTARLLAKALLCEQGPTAEPDGTCDACNMVAEGNHPDVYELDAASRTGVENVREEIIGRVQFAATQGRYKIYIIDEVHMLSTAAFNALLKTLEEPPSHVVFILCTTDPQKVPETIHSRCQRFDFHRISTEAIVSRLGAICMAEDVEFEGEALDLIAHRAEGGMRNALTSLEQLIAFGEGKVSMKTAERLLGSLDSNDMSEIVTAIGKRDVARCFTWTAEYIETGADLAQFVRDLAEHIRNMYILSLSHSDTVLEINDLVRRELAEEMQYFGPDRLARMLGVLGDLSTELRTSINPRLSFEIALTRMVRPDSDVTLEALAERIEALESGHSATSSMQSVPLNAAQAVQAPVATEVSSAPAVTHVQQEAASASMTEAPATSAANSTPHETLSSAVSAPTQGEPVQSQAPEQHGKESDAGPSSSNPPDTSANLGNPAALQRIWQASLQQIKKSKAAYGVLFLNTKVSYDGNDQALVIEFPKENVFAFSAVQKPEIMSVVSEALQLTIGHPVPFRYAQASADQGAQAPVVSTAASSQAQAPANSQVPASLQAPTSPQAQSSPQVPANSESSAEACAPKEPQVSQIPVPTPKAAVPVPEPDPIPIDTYDDVAVKEAAVDASAPAPVTAPAPAVTPAPAPAATPASAPTTTPAPAPAQSTGSSVAKESSDADDLKNMLTQEYGEGIVFGEVEE